jgi:16S rRNA processing protein RimM
VTETDAGWVVLARVVRPQGRRGEVLAEILTDFPESFATRKRLFLKPDVAKVQSEIHQLTLEAYWLHKGRIVLKFSGIDSIEDAEKLRDLVVAVPREERIRLLDDSVYVSDLLGARVIDTSKGLRRQVGEIVDVLPGGIAPPMLVVSAESPDPVLIPFVKAYLRSLDLEVKQIEMELPAGLTTLNDPETGKKRRTT